jgi:hypothetical protein
MFEPLQMRPRIRNWASVAPRLLARLRNEARGDPRSPSAALLRELGPQAEADISSEEPDPVELPIVPLELDVEGATLRLFNTITTFGTPKGCRLAGTADRNVLPNGFCHPSLPGGSLEAAPALSLWSPESPARHQFVPPSIPEPNRGKLRPMSSRELTANHVVRWAWLSGVEEETTNESPCHHHRRHSDLACRRRQPWAELPRRITAGALAVARVGNRCGTRHRRRLNDLRRSDDVRPERADPPFRLAWRYHPHRRGRLPRLARHPGLAGAAGGFASRRGRGSPTGAVCAGWAAGWLPDGDHQPKTVAFFLGLFAAAVPAATPLWAKLACCQQAGSSRSPGTRPCPLRFPPVRCGRDSRTSGARWSHVIGTLLIAVGLKVAPDAR